MKAASSRIAGFFAADHRGMGALLIGIQFASLGERRRRFKEFDRHLERHIRWEEDVLFPAACEKHPALKSGPVAVMLAEHREIRTSKAAAFLALRWGDMPAVAAAERRMLQVLSHHNAKEEQFLYPFCDRALSREEVDAILGRLEGGEAAIK